MHCVRWHCKYGISYRDLEEMMVARGLEIDHATVYRGGQHYTPELKRRDWYNKRYARRWHLHETYIKSKENGSTYIAQLMSEVIQLIFICLTGVMRLLSNGFLLRAAGIIIPGEILTGISPY